MRMDLPAPRAMTVPRETAHRPESETGHRQAVARRVFEFGRNVLDYADRYPARYLGRRDEEGAAAFRRYMDAILTQGLAQN